MHYTRWRTHGDPLIVGESSRYKRRNKMPSGYIRVWAPGHPTAMKDGYALEHRKMAWDAGMFSDLSLQIHHKNEIRDDNRLENLEPKEESAHHKDHIAEAGFVDNQYGRFPVLTDKAEREAWARQHWKNSRARKKLKAQFEK